MPTMNGTGPAGYGPLTGRGLGNCGAVPRCGAIHRGPSSSRSLEGRQGTGPGWGLRPGRGLGWFAAGYQGVDERRAGENIRKALESRIAALRAELAKTEELIGAAKKDPESGKDSAD